MTHSELCDLAVRWLRRAASQGGPGCLVAASECTGSYSGEIADAIGFRNVGSDACSVVIEAKLTRSDFIADARKPHRNGTVTGMGTYRYYLAPAGLISVDELPAGWGLIEVSERGAPKVRCGHVLEKPQQHLGWRRDTSQWQHTANTEREAALLVRLLARVGDVEALQKKLKLARNQVSQAERIIEQQRIELREAMKQYWELHGAYEAAIRTKSDLPGQQKGHTVAKGR